MQHQQFIPLMWICLFFKFDWKLPGSGLFGSIQDNKIFVYFQIQIVSVVFIGTPYYGFWASVVIDHG